MSSEAEIIDRTIRIRNGITREQLATIINNPEICDNTNWSRLIAQKGKRKALESFSKGAWLEDKDGEFLTAFTQKLPARFLLGCKVKTAEVRILRAPNKDEHKKASEIREMADRYAPTYWDSLRKEMIVPVERRKMLEDVSELESTHYEWVTFEQYVDRVMQGEKFIDVLGAEPPETIKMLNKGREPDHD